MIAPFRYLGMDKGGELPRVLPLVGSTPRPPGRFSTADRQALLLASLTG